VYRQLPAAFEENHDTRDDFIIDSMEIPE